ncbi:MAG: hypothetical protein Q9222_003291 [Ikaeria aurantiellina]
MRTKTDVIKLENRIPYLDPKLYRRQTGLLGYGRRITELFTVPRARRATVASFLVMCAQQMTGILKPEERPHWPFQLSGTWVKIDADSAIIGINVFAFLASTILEYNDENRPGIHRKDSLWLFFAFGAANFLSSTVAYFYIDRQGRRWLLMVSLAAMFPLLIATAFSFIANGKLQKGLVATFLLLFTFAYSPGAGAVPFIYSSEVFPQILRGLDVLAFILVWLFVPGMERQIATMEEMNYVFAVPTRQHVRYQIYEVLPWAINHYIRRLKDATCDPLYRYARDLERTNEEAEEYTDHEEKAATVEEVV